LSASDSSHEEGKRKEKQLFFEKKSQKTLVFGVGAEAALMLL
jgi:hypothetical protein